jgi:hypothetical protein
MFVAAVTGAALLMGAAGTVAADEAPKETFARTEGGGAGKALAIGIGSQSTGAGSGRAPAVCCEAGKALA